MAHHSEFFLFAIISIAAFGWCQAIEFHATNHAKSTVGGARFNHQIGIKYAEQTMNCSTEFIWTLLNETCFQDRKPRVTNVTLFLETIRYVAYTDIFSFQIHVGADYIGNYSGDVKFEFTGILYHEMTHVWQWFPEAAPTGLTEGIADFVRLKAGLAPSHWVKPGQGDHWDYGYDVTAFFLDYCDGLRHGFVAELNRKMRHTYSDDYFFELLGKKVDELWNDYKAMHGH